MWDTTLELPHGTLSQCSVPELIATASANGFEAITVTPPMYNAACAEGLAGRDLRALLDDFGIRVSYLEGLVSVFPGLPEADRRNPSFRWVYEYGESVFHRIAEDLGAGSVCVQHVGCDPATPRAAMTDALGSAAARAARHGLRRHVEFIPGTGIPDLPAAADMVASIGADNLGVLVDTWHLARSGGGPDQLTGAVASNVSALQINDHSPGSGREPLLPLVDRLLPGDGELPLVEILQPIRMAHRTMPVGIEVVSSGLRELPASEAAERVARAARHLLAQMPD
jgi:sugar phosphate isomerase/epimerase